MAGLASKKTNEPKPGTPYELRELSKTANVEWNPKDQRKIADIKELLTKSSTTVEMTT